MPEGDRERKLLERDLIAGVVEGSESRAPLLGSHPTDLLEANAEQHAGSVVEEHHDPVLVDEQARRGKRGQ